MESSISDQEMALKLLSEEKARMEKSLSQFAQEIAQLQQENSELL